MAAFTATASSPATPRSEEHTSELQSRPHLVCRLLLDPATTVLYTLSLHDALPILVGAALILLLATLTLVVMPYLQMSAEQVPPDLKPYTERQLEGRQIYIANGCVYCHSQQPRDP